MSISERIQGLLAQGRRVESLAAGRVGRVLLCLGDTVKIRLHDGNEAITSFETGDKVDLIYEAGAWTVINVIEDEAEVPIGTPDEAASFLAAVAAEVATEPSPPEEAVAPEPAPEFGGGESGGGGAGGEF